MAKPELQPACRRGRQVVAVGLGLGVLCLVSGWLVVEGQAPGDEARAKAALAQTLGMASLALAEDCTATRNMTEGICACLSDIPGGYCYHTSCDTTGSPEHLEPLAFRLEVEHPAGSTER